MNSIFCHANKFKNRTVIRFTSSISPGVRHEIERNGQWLGQGEWVRDKNTCEWLLVLPKEKGPSVLRRLREELVGLKHRDVDACVNFLNRLEISLQQIPDNDDYSGSASIHRDKIEIVFRHDAKSRVLTLAFGVANNIICISYVDEHDNKLSQSCDMLCARGATAILISALTS